MSRCISFKITSKEPVRIADNYRSKSGEMEILDYITGSALRGVIVNALAKDADKNADKDKKNQDIQDTTENIFETQFKRKLLSDSVCFLNAYPYMEGQELMPALKGFYESKAQDGSLQNLLVAGEFADGYKRAKLGRFCYVEGDKIYYTSTYQGETLHINTGNVSRDNQNKKDIFRVNYLKAGQDFAGRILLQEDDEDTNELVQKICEVLKKGSCRIGGNRSSGYGLCEISEVTVCEEFPYASVSVTKNITNKTDNSAFADIYMVVLSPVCMQNAWGEPCGIDWESLPQLLGVAQLETEKNIMSTSIIHTSGANRTWGIRTPELTAYEAGSVFHLFAGEGQSFDLDKLKNIEKTGLGIGRNYGFGRVLFIQDYQKLCRKQEIDRGILLPVEQDILSQKDINTDLRYSAIGICRADIRRAIQRYVTTYPLRKVSSRSQYGRIFNLCRGLKFQGTQLITKEFNKYMEHEREKDEHSHVQSSKRRDREDVFKLVDSVLKTDFTELLQLDKKILGFTVNTLIGEEEEMRYRLQLLESILRYANREEKNHE